MEAISYSYADKAHKRIKKIINDPDSTSGIVTVPKVIASGENITVPAGRIAVLPNLQIDGTLNVQGDILIPNTATTPYGNFINRVSGVTDNAVVRFDGTTGEVQNSNVIIDDNGNLNITGTGKRITGDFSNAAVGNRLAFQSSVANGLTAIGFMPNGTSNYSSVEVLNSSDTNNHSGLYIAANGTTDIRINSFARGTGTYLPMTFFTTGSERMRIDTSGNVGIGVTPSAWGSSWRSLDLLSSSVTSYTTLTDPYTVLSNNAYISGSSSILSSVYKNNGSAQSYNQGGGAHVWRIAPIGTAGNAITWTNAMTLDGSGSLLLTSGTGGLGYGVGAGGTVTQLTSKSTAVTLNKPTGQIFMNNAALAAGASVQFTVNNSMVNGVDNVILTNNIGASYSIRVVDVNDGNFYILVKNESAGSLSDAIPINFTIIKGAVV